MRKGDDGRRADASHAPLPPEGLDRGVPSVALAHGFGSDSASRPRRSGSAMHALKWLLAVAGAFALFFVAMTAGAVFSYSYDAARLSATTGRSVEDVVESGIYLTQDGSVRAAIAGQLTVLVVMLPLWRRVRRRAFGPWRRAGSPRDAGSIALAAAGIAIAGIGLQLLIGYVLGFALQFLPHLSHEYSRIMEDAGTGTLTPLSLLTVAILAPVIEEITCRGIMFECFLRAGSPRWNARSGAAGVPVSRRMVAAACVAQALTFAVMHGNIVQGSYALAMGIALGWVYWRTGSLAYNIGLHLAINFSSFAVQALGSVLDPLGYVACLALTGAVAAVGTGLFMLGTRRRAVPLGLPAAGESTASMADSSVAAR